MNRAVRLKVVMLPHTSNLLWDLRPRHGSRCELHDGGLSEPLGREPAPQVLYFDRAGWNSCGAWTAGQGYVDFEGDRRAAGGGVRWGRGREGGNAWLRRSESNC